MTKWIKSLLPACFILATKRCILPAFKSVLLAAVVFAASLGLPTHVLAQAANETVQTEGTIEIGDQTVTDEQIRARITELFDQIDGYQNVEVAVAGGVVTLTGQVLDNTAREELTRIVDRVSGTVAIENQTEISANLEERLAPAMERLRERVRNTLANAPIVIVAVLVFSVISLIGWTITTRLRVWKFLAPNSFIADVYRAVARIVFVLLGVVIALDILNATALLGAVLGAAGVVGLALGFAVRDTVENFIASILLSLRQPFRPNDFVDIDGDLGSVARLTSRATILISPDGNQIRIPNATVFKGRIVNYSRDPNRRFSFDLGVDAEADLAGALSCATQALNGLPFVLTDPPVSAWVSEVGDSNVVLTFVGWVDQDATDFMKGRGEAIRTAKSALEAAGFGLPEPIYRLRLDDRDMTRVLTSALPAERGTTAVKPDPAPPPAEPVSDLPQAADPTLVHDAADDAVSRERQTAGTGEDLLNDKNPTE